jgi:hypothetical protein
MLKILNALILMLAVSTVSSPAQDDFVNGYTRGDGTYVGGYWRSQRDSTVNNNFSTQGNQNPYTGEWGRNARDSGARSQKKRYPGGIRLPRSVPPASTIQVPVPEAGGIILSKDFCKNVQRNFPDWATEPHLVQYMRTCGIEIPETKSGKAPDASVAFSVDPCVLIPRNNPNWRSDQKQSAYMVKYCTRH